MKSSKRKSWIVLKPRWERPRSSKFGFCSYISSPSFLYSLLCLIWFTLYFFSLILSFSVPLNSSLLVTCMVLALAFWFAKNDYWELFLEFNLCWIKFFFCNQVKFDHRDWDTINSIFISILYEVKKMKKWINTCFYYMKRKEIEVKKRPYTSLPSMSQVASLPLQAQRWEIKLFRNW
jgi:hypothetical protein